MKSKASPPSSPLPKLSRAETTALVVLPIFFFLLVAAIYFPSELSLRLHLPIVPSPRQPPDFRLLIGVFTMANKFEVRHLHRLMNSFHPPTTALVDVKFVFCKPTEHDQKVLISLEILRYHDIMLLDCKENMDKGKTYDFLSAVANMKPLTSTSSDGNSNNNRKKKKPQQHRQQQPPYDYVMKADDDTYIRIPTLVRTLRPLPREDLYFGFYVDPDQFDKGDVAFMAGMGYALSWDLVDWISKSDMVKKNRVGYEDRLVGRWLHDGGKGKNVYDTKPSGAQWSEFNSGSGRIIETREVQYDLPRPPYKFFPNTISVHRIKDDGGWAMAAEHFNLTAGLRPSRFYDVTWLKS